MSADDDLLLDFLISADLVPSLHGIQSLQHWGHAKS